MRRNRWILAGTVGVALFAWFAFGPPMSPARQMPATRQRRNPPQEKADRAPEPTPKTVAAVAPAVPEKFEPWAEPADLLEWSQPVNGLRARIEMAEIGPRSAYAGSAIFVRLENVSNRRLVVPTANPDVVDEHGPFRLTVQYLDRQSAVRWNRDSVDMRTGNGRARPPATLSPGESVLCYLAGAFDGEMHMGIRFKVSLTVEDTSDGPDSWTGTVETPARPVRVRRSRMAALLGTLPMPTHFPRLSRERFVGGNMWGREPSVHCAGISNSRLLAQLRLYRPADVAAELDRRAATEADLPLQLLYFAESGRRGSAIAKAFLLQGIRSADPEMKAETADALHRFADGEKTPDWVVDAVTGAAAGDGSRDQFGFINSRRAVPMVLALARAGSKHAIRELGGLRDERAVPVLMEIVEKHAPDARVWSGMLLPEELEAAVHALGRLKATQAVPLLMKHVIHGKVVEALERIGDRRALSLLQEIATTGKYAEPRGTDEFARKSCVAAARRAVVTLEADPLPGYEKLLFDTTADQFERRKVVWNLGDKPDPRAIPMLLKAARTDPSGAVVNGVVHVMTVYPYKEAVKGLIDLFDADFEGKADWKRARTPAMFRDSIAETLEKLTGENLGPLPQRWRDWWESVGRNDPTLK